MPQWLGAIERRPVCYAMRMRRAFALAFVMIAACGGQTDGHGAPPNKIPDAEASSDASPPLSDGGVGSSAPNLGTCCLGDGSAYCATQFPISVLGATELGTTCLVGQQCVAYLPNATSVEVPNVIALGVCSNPFSGDYCGPFGVPGCCKALDDPCCQANCCGDDGDLPACAMEDACLMAGESYVDLGGFAGRGTCIGGDASDD